MPPHSNPHPSSPTCIVLGGGIAGIAAATRLAQQGIRVTLVETRKRLGGRATSFTDPATGRLLDNCQHVLLGCCTNLIDLYRRLGVDQHIRWHKQLHFTDGSGHTDTLEADDLPAPLHLTTSLMAFRGLTAGEKVAIARAMFAIMRVSRAHRDRLHHVTFAHWLAEHRQPPGAIEKFWAVIAVGAVNELPDRMAADYALQVFQEGFLANNHAYVMGLSAVPLQHLYDAAEKVLQESAGTLMLSTSAEQFTFDPHTNQITGLRINGNRTLTADAYVSALPFDRLEKVCAPEMLTSDARLRRLWEFHFSPIIGVHFWLALPSSSRHPQRRRRVMKLPHLVLTRSPLHWIFNKGHDPQVGGQHLHGVISAAHDLVSHPSKDIARLAVQEARKVLPRMAHARLIHAHVIKEKRATFSARPGVSALRPHAHPPAAHGTRNLFLAGDWTATGWPATMEGATRSGYTAASALLNALKPQPNSTHPLPTPDLPPTWLYRALSRI